MMTRQSQEPEPDASAGVADLTAVLVGIVTRDRATILPEAINSALAQSYPHAKVAVLDDGSQDATRTLGAQFEAVNWYRSPTSLGLMEARNRLMRLPARYFLSLDDDAWFMNGDEIALGAQYLDDHPQVAAVAFDILGPSRPRPVARTAPHAIEMFMGCGHLLRLSAALAVGLYHPSPEPYGSEEKDLSIRLLDRHMEVHLLPGVHVWHERANVARDLGVQHQMGVCNDLAFALKRCPLVLLPVVFPFKFLNHLRFGMRQPFFLRHCFLGIQLFVGHLGKIWSGRAPVKITTFVKFLRLARSK